MLKSFRSEIQDGRHGILKIYFCFFSWTERPLAWNLVGSIKVTCLGVSLTLCCFVFYVLPCVIVFVCFSVLLALRLPRLGKRGLILVLFVRLFDLCVFAFVDFLFLLVSGRGCGLWLWRSLGFSLTYFCRSNKKLKKFRSEIQDGRRKIYFSLLLLTRKANWLETW